MSIDRKLVNRAQSVLAKLLHIRDEHGIEHNLLITRFVQERFLYRLSQSPHAKDFVLKGGLLITAVTDLFYRATADIDLQTRQRIDAKRFEHIVRAIAAQSVDDDGVIFENDVRVEPIRAQMEEPGLRAILTGRIGTAQTRVQVDAAYGDKVLLPVPHFEYPVLLAEYAPPVLGAYSNETIIAEKLEACARFDLLQSRYKDYDDVLEIAARGITMPALWMAVQLTFGNRNTSIERLVPTLNPDRATAERARAYERYRNRENVKGETEPFAQRLERVRAFAAPIVAYGQEGRDRRYEDGTWILN